MIGKTGPARPEDAEAPLLDLPFQGDVEALVRERGCFAPEENERIYRKWFHDAPRYLFRAVDRKHRLTGGRLLDVGCSYGMNLLHCRAGSYGIEIDAREAAFAKALGLPVYRRDAMHDDLAELPRVEAIWCAAVLEHVDSPHHFLRRLYGLLQPGGLLAVFVPTIPIFPFLGRLPRIGDYFSGHVAMDHVNAFTPRTLAFTCERAGFRTLEVSPFYPGPLRMMNHLPGLERLIDGCVYVGRAIPDWEYPQKSSRRVRPE
jgi:SAM-dependent methyltransferase